MGVHGLWELLAPVGRRVSVETLSGKKLAIDASIWMVQFMKAMRDEKGEMVRNAHLLGFFRRICKLLYLRTKPVFVFDGGTPALKRRTVIARRRQRENAQAKIRKTAEKLLINHLKATKLKELSKNLEEQRKGIKGKKKVLLDEISVEADRDLERDDYHETLDDTVAASTAAGEGGRLNNKASSSAAVPASVEVVSDEEEIILPEMGHVDPDVLAALPPSMQLDLMMREGLVTESGNNNQEANQVNGNQNRKLKDSTKGKEILSDKNNMEGGNLEKEDDVAGSYNQEKLDEMLAASLMADQDGSLTKKASTSAANIPFEEEGGDEDEEMIMPHGNIDPAVLAALPPSMQLDLLVQMRERLMAENRQRYQKVKKAPEKFSELQIEAYLKTVAFRREIDQVQRAASGKDVGGLQTSRIASEGNREFIFSSSFTGDKELLTSAGAEETRDKEHQKPIANPSDFINNVPLMNKSYTAESVLDESRGVFDDGVETYLDESGRIRVSRVRAMGIRMTRDLQRNLDLMKEVERERTHAIKVTSAQSALNGNDAASPKKFPSKDQLIKGKDSNSADFVGLNEQNRESLFNNESSIQISFDVDSENKCFDCDDDIFASLVAGRPVKISSLATTAPTRDTSDSDDWEEGIIEGNISSNDPELITKPLIRESNKSDDSEMEWEDGPCDIHENSLGPAELGKPVSRGYLEEEAALQEAIRRSLEDQVTEKSNHSQSKCERLSSVENAYDFAGLLDQEKIVEPRVLGKDVSQHNKLSSEIGKLDDVGQISVSQAFLSPQRWLKSPEGHNPDIEGMRIDESWQLRSCEGYNVGMAEILIDEPCKRFPGPNLGQPSYDTSNMGNMRGVMSPSELAIPSEAKELHLIAEQGSDTLVNDVSTSTEMCSGEGSHTSKAASGDLPHAVQVDAGRNDMKGEPSALLNEEKINSGAESSIRSVEVTNPSVSFGEESAKDLSNGGDFGQNLGVQKCYDDQSTKRAFSTDQSEATEKESAQVAFTKASLEEELLNLGQESMILGDEQRKLERNVESVSTEMFTECQELLQMFGLPYIIAPMEAEAQCAYMELANLVDGVVTDDSDVFLFGAQSVYKNIFDDRKYVETYFMKDVEKELGLTREKLIRMALLLGSDYTEGVSGIGIVNAIEVVDAFPEDNGLHKFREWIESPDPNILGKFNVQTGSSARKKISKVGGNDVNFANNDEDGITPSGLDIPQACEEKDSADQIQEIKQIFMDKHRNVSKNWHIPSSFPSEAVISAYLCPQVDKSTEPFTWGKPDLHVLHRLCWEKFGWGIQKSDELLLPVLKEYEKHETQLRLEAFYTFNERFAKIRSKRIKKAVKGITGNQSVDLMDEPMEELSKDKRKKRDVTDNTGDKQCEEPLTRTEESYPGIKSSSVEKPNAKMSRKKQNAGEPVLSGRHQTSKGSYGNGRGRGRGRGRGKTNIGYEQSDSSSGDVNSGDERQQVHIDQSESSREVRRSKRSRKPVSYVVNDMEVDGDESLDQCHKKGFHEDSLDEGLSWSQGVCGDAVIGLQGEEQHKMEDPSLTGNFSTDYLDKGGGFCDDEIDQPDGSQNACPSDSGDYLKMGGGFCVDESETGRDEGTAQSSPPAAVREIVDPSPFSGHVRDAESGSASIQSMSGIKNRLNEYQDGGMTDAFDNDLKVQGVEAAYDGGDHSLISASPPKRTKASKGASSITGLRAMPFLKRKRRKT